MDDVTTRTYHGSLERATLDFQSDAARMAQAGFYPTSQSYQPGSWGCGAFLVALLLCIVLIGILVFIYMIIVKPDGTLTVTYQRQAPGEATKVCPRCAKTVKRAANVCRFCGYEFVWAPTHRVPDGGMPAWSTADPAMPSAWTLNSGVGLIVVERLNDWARVEANNGWTGWVDFRKLVSYDTPRSTPDEGTPSPPAMVAPDEATAPYPAPVDWDTSAATAGSRCGRCGKHLSPAWVGKCQHCGARYTEFPPVVGG